MRSFPRFPARSDHFDSFDAALRHCRLQETRRHDNRRDTSCDDPGRDDSARDDSARDDSDHHDTDPYHRGAPDPSQRRLPCHRDEPSHHARVTLSLDNTLDIMALQGVLAAAFPAGQTRADLAEAYRAFQADADGDRNERPGHDGAPNPAQKSTPAPETASGKVIAAASQPVTPLSRQARRPRPLTDPVRIRRALGLGTRKSASQLAQARRIFAQANHPDLFAPALRPDAEMAMRIANAMIDEALRLQRPAG